MAPIDNFLRLMDAHGIERAILVQPSSLGTDNSYLLAALATYRDRLRGIVDLDSSTTVDELDDLTAKGVIGLRYSLLSYPRSALAHARHQALTTCAAARRWWIDVQAHGPDWPKVLPEVADAHLIIDHFGRPSGPACPGLRAILGRDTDRTAVKLSAPYLVGIGDPAAIARQLIDHFGAERCRGWLRDRCTDREIRIMSRVAPDLAGFVRPTDHSQTLSGAS